MGNCDINNPNMRPKSHRWCFTCWDFNSVMWFKAHKLHLTRMMIVGQEICPMSKKLHFQGYVEFVKEYDLSSVKRIWPDLETHWETARENDKACIAYCSKDGNLVVQHNVLSNYLKRDIDWDDLLC